MYSPFHSLTPLYFSHLSFLSYICAFRVCDGGGMMGGSNTLPSIPSYRSICFRPTIGYSIASHYIAGHYDMDCIIFPISNSVEPVEDQVYLFQSKISDLLRYTFLKFLKFSQNRSKMRMKLKDRHLQKCTV